MHVLEYLNLGQKHKTLKKDSFNVFVKINVITNFTDQILQKLIIGLCLEQSIFPEIAAVPYKQYDFALADKNSFLYTKPADITFIFFDLSPLIHSPFSDKEQKHFSELSKHLTAFCAATKTPVIINTFPTLSRSVYGNLFELSDLSKLANEYNAFYKQLSNQFSNVHTLNSDTLLAYYGEKNARDKRGTYAFDIPFTNEFSLLVAREWVSLIGHLKGKIRKCIVVDLDNTLWGGVVGELGTNGVSLGPQYPGVAFQNFQRTLLSCHERGILLAINSKNNSADVDEIFEKNPHMVLKKKHFAATRVNWESKVTNIVSIAQELNIGIDSLVFIDDDPINREMVRHQLPEVLVPEFTLAPEEYVEYFLALPIFNQFKLTDEDKEKGKMYSEEKLRQQVLAVAPSPEEYIAALGLTITIKCNEKQWLSRLAQLTQKTNQFNVTTKRYSEKEMEEWMNQDLVYAAEVKDTFGSYGITILCIIKKVGTQTSVDTFLMSCRVMGRGAEEIFMDYIIKDVRSRGVEKIVATFIPTAKNEPAKSFFPNVGFTSVAAQENGRMDYELVTKNYTAEAHKYSKIITIVT